MKKNINLILMLIFVCWACNDPFYEIITSKYEVPQSTTDKDSYDYPKLDLPQFNPDLIYDSIADIEGNVYKTIQIGNQIWMAENLRTTRYNDGSLIYMGTGDMAGETDWFDLSLGSYCWYYNDEFNKTFGAIYNWHALESGKLAPAGWHVPTNKDWATLINYLGGEKSAHDKMLSSGTNESGFSAVSSPILCGWGFLPELSFWSATPYGFYLEIWEENSVAKVSLFSCSQTDGLCVRCLKDNPL